MPSKHARSGMRGRWQPSGWVSGGRAGSIGQTAAQTASTTAGSRASTKTPSGERYRKSAYFRYPWEGFPGENEGAMGRAEQSVLLQEADSRPAKNAAEIPPPCFALPRSPAERRGRFGE